MWDSAKLLKEFGGKHLKGMLVVKVIAVPAGGPVYYWWQDIDLREQALRGFEGENDPGSLWVILAIVGLSASMEHLQQLSIPQMSSQFRPFPFGEGSQSGQRPVLKEGRSVGW